MPEQPTLLAAITARLAEERQQRTAGRQAREAAHFVPIESHERTIRARERDPEAFAVAYRGHNSLELAFYEEQRAAAIAAGAFTPPTLEDPS